MVGMRSSLVQRGALVVAVLCLLALRALAACILADPPAELPVTPSQAPQIQSMSVVPALPIIYAWPTEFDIPVLVSGGATVEWRIFADFTNLLDEGEQAGGNDDAGVRLIQSSASPPVPDGASQCHLIEFLVAFHFTGQDNRTPDLGSSVAWLYDPSGAFDGCPQYDAGSWVDGSFPPDTAADGPIIVVGDGSGGDGGLE